jgi:hypothetical protein
MIRIDFNGETLLVRSLEGYDGATVLADSVTAPPSEFHEPKPDGGWQLNTTRRDAAKRREMFADMDRAELVDWILDKAVPRIKALEDRITALEAKVP